MAATFDAAKSGAQKSNVLPPWPWFWLIIYILGLPTIFSLIGSDLSSLFTPAPEAATGDLFPFVYALTQQATAIGEILLYLALLLGVLSLLFPPLRTGFLERRYQLTLPDKLPATTLQITRQTLMEVSSFVRRVALDLSIKYSVSARPLPGYAFVYPIGYRKMGMALSGALLARWRDNRPAAEAILLHEIAHYRQGDAYIVGTGSLVETIIRSWPLLYAVFFFIPLLLFFIIEQISIAQTVLPLQPYLQTGLAPYLHSLVTIDLPFLLISLFSSLFWTGSLYIIVLMSIWCAELNADRFVADTMQSPTALLAAMEHHAPSSLRRWIFSELPHPPASIRSRIARRSQETGGLALLLLLFPAAWLIRAVFLLGWVLFQELPLLYNGASMSYVLAVLGISAVNYLEAPIVLWIAICALFLLWPLLARYWERFFGRVRNPLVGAKYSAYLFSTSTLALLCIIGLVLSALPVPTIDQLGSPTPISPASVSNHPDGHFEAGEQVTIGKMWLVTVSNVQMRASTGYIKASSGKAFLGIDVSLKNIDTTNHLINSSTQFTLQDLHGVSYPLTFLAPTLPPEASTPAQDGNVAAGGSAHGQLNYEVPASIQQFTLSFKADWQHYDPTTSKQTVWDISVAASNEGAGTGSSTPTPPLSGYPALAQAYQGSVVNTTDNANVQSTVSLASIKQDQQGHITCYLTIQPPLVGSGPCTGSVSKNGRIQFTVTPDDGSGIASIQFTGTIHPNGSMDGSYTLPGTNEVGTWQLSPS
jgi:Zn-dependent protease with chaperone function